MDTYSIVDYYAYQTQRECGYCNRPNTNCNHGMWAQLLSVQDYQNLIDRGWRRSGCYCYKPTLDKTCCPMYTIRCEALDFKITKSQKKILKRMGKFLRNELPLDKITNDSIIDTPDNIDTNNLEARIFEDHRLRAEENISQMKVESMEGKIENRLGICQEEELSNQSRQDLSTQKVDVPFLEKKSSTTHEESSTGRKTLQDPSKPPPKKAKLMRVERKKKKLLAQGKSPEDIDILFKSNKQIIVKSVEDLYDEIHGGVKKLETKLVRVMSDEFLETLDVSASLYKKYQMAIHKNEPEECSKQFFFNFLVKSPLQPYKPENGPPQGYGSFHEQYWLDGKLIAVAVIDVLPISVSSVYFFYDPEYSFLSLGTFSSLREICLTRQLNKLASALKYYYMGFYIHSNVKMRYKAKIRPSKLLCPETYVWCDIDRSIAKLDKEKYSRLNEDIDAIDIDGIVDIEKVKILSSNGVMKYRSYEHRSEEEDESVREYAKLVGMKCAQNMILYRK
ncbi:arginyl-tRNA--protein transferase 1 [Venturia canescens]|uniref:arginyl-tRNA--protein transferase 1 n=1 Tax=Venturia canescens TaxID=32260 RepID=UPI001C9D3405|nr:arginyl-tRNA--protein transferase 1 [Venturia canescens]